MSHQLRNIECYLGPLKDLEPSLDSNYRGCSVFKIGLTVVMAVVYSSLSKKSGIEIRQQNFAMPNWSRSNANTKNFDDYILSISEVLQSVTNFASQGLNISIHIISANGSLLTACINATVTALINAGVALSDMPVALTAGVYNDELVLDPISDELLLCSAVIDLAIQVNSKKIVLLKVNNACTATQLRDFVEELSDTIKATVYLQIKKSIAKDFHLGRLFSSIALPN